MLFSIHETSLNQLNINNNAGYAGNTTYLLGGFKNVQWKWNDGTPWIFTDFSQLGGKANGTRILGCLEIQPDSGWLDGDCEGQRPFMCTYGESNRNTYCKKFIVFKREIIKLSKMCVYQGKA